MNDNEKGGLEQAASAAHTVHSAVKTGKAVSAAIDEILAEGVADAQARAAQDFASTGGDNYEITQPFTVSSNTNSFVGQYCAARRRTGPRFPWKI